MSRVLCSKERSWNKPVRVFLKVILVPIYLFHFFPKGKKKKHAFEISILH